MQRKFIAISLFLISLGCDDKLAWIKTPDVVTPVVSGIAPTSGTPGTTVEIVGTNFSPVVSNNSVTINETAANVIDATPGKLTIVVPNETTGPVVVTVNGKRASNKPVFTYQ